MGSWDVDGFAGGIEAGEWPLGLTQREHRVPPAPRPLKAQAGPAPSFLRGLLWVPQSPREPGTECRCHRPTVPDPSPLQHASPIPSGPSSSTCPEASTARAWSTGAQTRPPPLPSPRPSTTCLGLRAPLLLLRRRRTRLPAPLRRWRPGPLPFGPWLLTDHVTLFQSPCPNFRTLSGRCGVQPFRRGPSGGRLADTHAPARAAPRPLAERPGRCAQPGRGRRAPPDSH